MGVVPAVVGPAPAQRRLPSGSIALVAGLGVALAIGLVSIVVVAHRAGPAPAAHGVIPAAGPVGPAPEPLITHAVRYELSGDDALDITYVTQGSDIAQVAEASGPWSASLERRAAEHSSQYYSLSARDAGRGTLECRIVVDGTVVSERAVSGPNGVVRCSKTLS